MRLGYAIFAIATLYLPGLRRPATVAGLGARHQHQLSAWCSAGYWWEVLFDALAIASLVVGITLISDAVEGAIDQ